MKDPAKMSDRELRLEVRERRLEEAETTYHDCRHRYENDPLFHNLVDLLLAHAMQHKYTPGELRDAAFMAALRYEEITVQGRYFVRRSG
jgi:hypothetical protein